ncbi:MAG: sarcosine oxidase subunit gamma [Methylophilaceae bacterium]|nr:sarcosine oxidase subunit gamma [Methylophilaceae bacterium]
MSTINQRPVSNTPIAYGLMSLSPTMGVINGMEVALEFEGALIEGNRKSILGVTDVSCFASFGIKGTEAASWLMSQSIQIPMNRNTWVEHEGYLVLRLGGSEFLIEGQYSEDQYSHEIFEKLARFNQATVAGVYKVQRADAAFILSGSEVLNMLSELCMLDLRDSALASNTLVMTQLASISAILLRHQLNGEQVYRVWCDGTYGAYMWNMLLEVARELGGGAVGLASHFRGTHK